MERAKPSDTRSTLPAGLERSTPRQVTLSAAGWALSVVAVLLAVGAVALPVFLLLDREKKEHQREILERSGVRAEAEIVRVGKTGGDHPQRFANYRYPVGARVYRGRVELRDSDHRALMVGGQLPVRYLPADPALSWVLGYEPWGAPVAVIALVPLAFAAAAAAIAWAVNRQRWLLEEGRATCAKVCAVRRKIAAVSAGGHGHSSGYRVEYEFLLLSGAVKRIKLQSQKKPEEGATVTLIYDRDNPKTALRYPFQLVRLARQ